MPLRVLAIGAHPDDMEFEAGGTLAKFASRGHIVKHLIMTEGGYVDTSGKVHTSDKLHEESRKAGGILGLDSVNCFKVPTGFLKVDRDTVGAVDDVIEDFLPDIVITVHPYDSHQDHKATAEIVFACARQGSIPALFCSAPFPSKLNLLNFKPSLYVDISEVIDLKIKAVEAYQSQYSKFGGKIFTHRITSTAEFYGWAHSCKYAEAFEVFRMCDNLFLEE